MSGRKPIQIERAGMRTQRERVWDLARRLRSFTAQQIKQEIVPTVPSHTVENYLTGLLRAGYLKHTPAAAARKANGDFDAGLYSVVRDSLEAPRVDVQGKPTTLGVGFLAMWRAMQVLREFDFRELARAASIAKQFSVQPSTARAYIGALHRAGYLQQITGRKGAAGGRYRLIRNTGALPPAVTKRKCVFDRNLGQFMWQEEAQEVVDGIE